MSLSRTETTAPVKRVAPKSTGPGGERGPGDLGRNIASNGLAARLTPYAVRLCVPVGAVIAWVLLTSVTHSIAPIDLPSPTEVLGRVSQLHSLLLPGLETSLEMVFSGFAIGGILGVSSGLLFGYSRVARNLFEFTVDAIRPVPLFALIPLFILWFGIGMRPQITLVAVGVFLIMSLATIEAVRNVPPIYVRAALTLGASRPQVYRTVVIPAILPTMLTGVRYAIASAWGLDVAAEFTGSQQGLGYIMIVREESLDTAGILLVVIIFCLLAIVADRLVRWLTRRLTRWAGKQSDHGMVRDMLGGV